MQIVSAWLFNHAVCKIGLKRMAKSQEIWGGLGSIDLL
jgi:hypothetical protein